MAKIYLNIEADDAADLRLTLAELAGDYDIRQAVEDGEVDVRRLVAQAGSYPEDQVERQRLQDERDAELGERQGRFKRTKDEIARGLTPEQAKVERAASALEVHQAIARPAEQTVPSGERTAGGSPVFVSMSSRQEALSSEDPFAQPSPPTSSASPASTAPTIQDVRSAVEVFLKTKDGGAAAVKAIMAAYKDEAGEPCASGSKLLPADYAAVIERLAA